LDILATDTAQRFKVKPNQNVLVGEEEFDAERRIM
jgi:hypothetical protein